MPRVGHLKTSTPRSQTEKEIRDVFRKWPEVQAFDVRVGLTDAEVLFTVNGKQQRLACDRFGDPGTNLRALYLALDATRKAAQRGILEELAAIATALLTPGVIERPPHEVLGGIAASASLAVAEAVYKTLAKERHPDAGGSDAAMKELNRAIEWYRQRS